MSLRPYIAHHCFSQHLGEPRPEKCRCNVRVDKETRDRWLSGGLAEHIVENILTDRIREFICPHCGADEKWMRTCLNCNKTGKLMEKVITQKVSENIVMTVHSVAEAGEALGLVRDSKALKTPRVQTIERPHIERAYLPLQRFGRDWIYLKNTPMDAERIEEWGRLNWAMIAAPRVKYFCVECDHLFTETYPLDECMCGGPIATGDKIPALIHNYWPEINDPFEGRTVLPLIGFDQRSPKGKDVVKDVIKDVDNNS